MWSALINGMALGIRHETPNDIEQPFQQTGTLHLFAVAGLHVGIIAQLLWIVASLLRFPRTVAAAVIIPCLFFYSAITGFHVSSLRAATMAAFLLGGIFFDRPVLALNSLAGAALVILGVDSNQLFTSGFQLSFAVVGAILVWRAGIVPRPVAARRIRSLSSTQSRQSEPARLRTLLRLAGERNRALSGSMVRFVLAHHLVFLPDYADLPVGESDHCADRVLRAGRRLDVARGSAAFSGALAPFQQRQLEPGESHSWLGADIRPTTDRSRLRGTATLADGRAGGNYCA